MLRIPLVRTVAAATLTFITAGCSKPGVNDLRDSSRSAAAKCVRKDFQKSADDLQFTGPGPTGP